MNKLIPTIILTTVVFSPLSLINLVSSAAAHHTRSHVATVSTNYGQVNRVKTNPVKKQVKLRKGLNRSL